MAFFTLSVLVSRPCTSRPVTCNCKTKCFHVTFAMYLYIATSGKNHPMRASKFGSLNKNGWMFVPWCLSDLPKQKCKTSPTSASASACCCTSSPPSSATSPSMVGPSTPDRHHPALPPPPPPTNQQPPCTHACSLFP